MTGKINSTQGTGVLQTNNNSEPVIQPAQAELPKVSPQESMERLKLTPGGKRLQGQFTKLLDQHEKLNNSKFNCETTKAEVSVINKELADTLKSIEEHEGKKHDLKEQIEKTKKSFESLGDLQDSNQLKTNVNFLEDKLKKLEDVDKEIDSKLGKLLIHFQELNKVVAALKESSESAGVSGQSKLTSKSPHPNNEHQANTILDSGADQELPSQKPNEQKTNLDAKSAASSQNHTTAAAQPKAEPVTPEHAFKQHQEMADRHQAIQMAMNSMSNLQNLLTTMQQAETARISAMCNQILDGVKAVNDLMKKGGAMTSGAIGQ